jgi:hypothetical protein
LPETLAEHDRVEPPEPPVILVWDTAHVRLVEFVVTPSATVPAKPLTDDREIVEVPATFVSVATLAGLAVILKSWT